jgi:hypothetical protein
MGTYRKEWPCCGSVTETQAWEPEECPFCTPQATPAARSEPFQPDWANYRQGVADGKVEAMEVIAASSESVSPIPMDADGVLRGISRMVSGSENVDTPGLRQTLEACADDIRSADKWAPVIAHITPLIEARVAGARKDAERLDWLEGMTVNVRVPLRYGSKDLFWATPDDHGDYNEPSNIRAQIDAAMSASPASGSQEQGAQRDPSN